MKKVFCILFVLPLLLSSCAASPSPLGYQENVTSAVCTLETGGGTYKVEITPGAAVKILEPEELSGVTLSLDGEKYTLASGGMTLDLPQTLIPLITPILNAFSLPAHDAKTSTSGDDTRVVKVGANAGDYEIKLNPDGSPFQITYKGAREFTLTDIKIAGYGNSDVCANGASDVVS